MNKFIRVTKANRNKDSGFIAVDAICAAFENKDSHITEIMTMDGFWYDVEEGVDEVFSEAIGNGKNNTDNKLMFQKRHFLVSPAVSEDFNPKRHEEIRKNKRISFVYHKKRGGENRGNVKRVFRGKDFPSGEGKEAHEPKTKAVASPQHEPTGL